MRPFKVGDKVKLINFGPFGSAYSMLGAKLGVTMEIIHIDQHSSIPIRARMYSGRDTIFLPYMLKLIGIRRK